MFQAIQVKYLGPTNSKGSRVKAWSFSKKSITIAIDHSKDLEENAREAAIQLLSKLEWQGSWVSGSLPNNDYCFVCIDLNTPLQVGI